jgi:hypothetical protein
MPFSEKEMLEDLHKVRVRKYVYFLGGLGILGLSVALVVLFFVKHDWPALLLAAVGAFWSVMLLYNAHRTRRLDGLISARLEGRSEGATAMAESGDRAEERPEGDGGPPGGVPGEP